MIRGVVIDQTHTGLSGVQITVTNNFTGLMRMAQTDDSGKFFVPGLPVAGSYNIKAVKAKFAERHLDNITLAGGTRADLELQLTVEGGQTRVTVVGVVGEVRADEPQLGDRLGAMQMEQTPLLNRKITYLTLLNAANHPAVNQGDVFLNQNLFTTNGSGRRQAWFEVDGSNGVDLWGRQTIFSNLPLASVQEMTVLENAFSAEYGASTGGVINIVTKSGGKRLHGEFL